MDCCGNPTLSPFSKDPDERLMKGRKYRKLSDLVYLWTVPNIPEAQVLHVQHSSANILRQAPSHSWSGLFPETIANFVFKKLLEAT